MIEIIDWIDDIGYYDWFIFRVSFDKRRKKWCSYVNCSVLRNRDFLGCYSTKEEARLSCEQFLIEAIKIEKEAKENK